MRISIFAFPLLFAALSVSAQRQRPVQLDDLERLKEISDPELSPGRSMDSLYRIDNN
jgi:hypothetical protein